MSIEIRHPRVGRHYPYLEVEGSLAFHVRRNRQWYGQHGISQHDLAMIAGVSQSFLRRAESGHTLQPSMEAMLRVSLALRRPIEDLVAPGRLREIREGVERRRAELERQADPSGHSTL
jgi:transcriptional regulator with XRE-family HTH domain